MEKKTKSSSDQQIKSVSLQDNTNIDERRQEIVQVTFRLIAEKGVEGLRIREVAARVGINIGTLYYYYPTKQSLIQGVVDFIVQHIVTMHGIAKEIVVENPADALRQHFTNLIIQLQETPDIFRVMVELLLRAERDTSIHPILRKTDDDWHEYLHTILLAGIEQGYFRADLHPQQTAYAIMSFFKGMPVQLHLSAEDLATTVWHFERWLKP